MIHRLSTVSLQVPQPVAREPGDKGGSRRTGIEREGNMTLTIYFPI